MNQKDFSKNGAAHKGVIHPPSEVMLLTNRYYEKLKAFAQKRPKVTVAGMIVFATLNFVLMIYIVNSRPAASLIPKNIRQTITGVNKSNNSADFSIGNYLKISKLKDSLDYLMKLPTLTKSDSLLFIRICDEYAKMDPTFLKQVSSAIDNKNKNTHHEKDNH